MALARLDCLHRGVQSFEMRHRNTLSLAEIFSPLVGKERRPQHIQYLDRYSCLFCQRSDRLLGVTVVARCLRRLLSTHERENRWSRCMIFHDNFVRQICTPSRVLDWHVHCFFSCCFLMCDHIDAQ